MKGVQWRKRKRAFLERKCATESSDSEPDVKKRRNVRKSIAATKKLFQCPKGKLGKGKKKVTIPEEKVDT